MIWFYRTVFFPTLLICLPYYLLRMFKRGGYGEHFGHRFGFIPSAPPRADNVKRIWIQAVSVGEVNAIAPLVERLAKQPQVELVISTTTSTAYTLVKEKYASRVIAVCYFPLDFWWCSALAWKRLNPNLAILMESELWPEHLQQAKKRNVPLLLINARMSDRSFKRYRSLPSIAAWLVKKPTRVLAATDEDYQRYLQLGVSPENIVTTGSIKFDVSIEPLFDSIRREILVKELGLHSAFSEESTAAGNPPLILLGSSTWPGEESFLIEVFEKALQEGLNCRLLLVPRHAERRNEIREILEKQSRSWHIRSRGKITPGKSVRIYLADTTGELAILSQIADVAFIGKSLAPNNGGQTPIEAAALGLPIIYGPNMNNFKLICKSLEKAQAAIRAKDAQEAELEILSLLRKANQRNAMAQASQAWHAKNTGAALRTFEHLKKYL